MVAIAKHEQTEEMVISDTYASSLEIKSKYPGKFLCYFCNGELYPVKAGFRKHRCGNLELEIFHRTHFRHAEGNSQYCVKSRGQSLEHIISLKFWQKKLSTASQEHFKSAVTIVYEPLLKGIDATGRPCHQGQDKLKVLLSLYR
ncbi:hypothetical protein WA1_50270 [Scytonema hofmannii PCC 7110]|uniref:Uncharacterized protein n=1 Tax=Scytonema hofmannii PCC 7110 TaxID=128403 RepID=A0A139WR52_9CYAN|nr:hypothetical protein [Scytonema hofmannii]KYC34913.1 hypothetical protein WA1_50270 [Scytonema hofmannii PCC 7110]